MSNSVIDSIQKPAYTPALPCPFCDGVAHQTQCDDGSWIVQCGNDNCLVYAVAGPCPIRMAAVAAWNKRVGETP